jgi:hypothetical protein
VDVEELKSWARRVRSDLPTNDVIDYLIDNHHGAGTVYSPSEVVRALRRHSYDSILATLLLLAGEPTGMLNGQWVYFDQEGEQFDLDPDAVAEAVRAKEFFHPLSGAADPSFLKSIGLVYTSAAAFDRIMGAVKRRPPAANRR